MITVKNLAKSFGGVKAIDGLSLNINSGDTLLIRGPSGSGKSTLLRLIAGLELPDTGDIVIDGRRVSTAGWASPPFERDIGFVFQRSALWPHMTVAQNIRFAITRCSRREAEFRLQDLLSQTDLTRLAHRYPNQLSGGEARRVAVARALASRPKHLLLDEPLTSLDPDLQERLLSMIQEYGKTNQATILYVTHANDEAMQFRGDTLWLHCGKVQYRNPTARRAIFDADP